MLRHSRDGIKMAGSDPKMKSWESQRLVSGWCEGRVRESEGGRQEARNKERRSVPLENDIL